MSEAFVLALMGHLIGDWIVQTDDQAARKMSSWAAMGRHVLTYHLVLAALLWPVLAPGALGIVLVVSASTHAFLDRRWPVRWLMRATGSSAFSETALGVLMTDQVLHVSILFAVLMTVT